MNKFHFLYLKRPAVLAVLSIGLLQGCSQTPEEPPEVVHPVKLFEVVDLQIQSIREFPARVEASKEASISFRIPGELQEFPVVSAQVVEQGSCWGVWMTGISGMKWLPGKSILTWLYTTIAG